MWLWMLGLQWWNYNVLETDCKTLLLNALAHVLLLCSLMQLIEKITIWEKYELIIKTVIFSLLLSAAVQVIIVSPGI